MDYECHITVPVSHAENATWVAETFDWKTSEIARDPLLGDDTHFYLTCHAKELNNIWRKMKGATSDLRKLDVPILREKIERIEYDRRY